MLIDLVKAIIAGVIGLTVLSAPAAAEKRQVRALLMGIKTYDRLPKAQQLELPPNDVAGIAAAIEKLDSTAVISVPAVKLSLEAMRRDWELHLGNLRDGETSFFWFSGHGTEIEGRSYLLPADVDPAKLAGVSALNNAAISIQKMLAEFQERVRGRNIVGVFVIDACRDTLMVPAGSVADPAAGNATSVNPSRPAEPRGGLVLSHPPPDTIVLFSAASRQVAVEKLNAGDRAKTSVYTRNLLELLEPGAHGIDVLKVPVEHLAKTLRWNVYQTSLEASPSRTQTPAYIDEMLKHRNLFGWDVAPAPPAEPKVAPKRQAAARIAGGQISRSLGLAAIIKDCDVCPELVEVPTGAFHIGSAPAPRRDRPVEPSEHPRMQITLAHRFAMGRFEVSRGEWLACQTSQDPKFKCAEFVRLTETGKSLRKPITDVTWSDTQRYVTWLNQLLSSKGHGRLAKYDLPSEAEWEYAARAGSTGAYSFGDDAADLCRHGNGADASLKTLLWPNWICKDGHGRETAQIDSYIPNAFGLHNMHGNVWEWTADCWAPTHDEIDTAGKARGAGAGCATRTVRGGSWRSGPWSLRSARRIGYAATHARGTLGFRVKLDLDDAK